MDNTTDMNVRIPLDLKDNARMRAESLSRTLSSYVRWLIEQDLIGCGWQEHLSGDARDGIRQAGELHRQSLGGAR